MDREAVRATVRVVSESRTQLSDFHFHFLAMVQSLVREDPTCPGQLSPCITTTEPVLHKKRNIAMSSLRTAPRE